MKHVPPLRAGDLIQRHPGVWALRVERVLSIRLAFAPALARAFCAPTKHWWLMDLESVSDGTRTHAAPLHREAQVMERARFFPYRAFGRSTT